MAIPVSSSGSPGRPMGDPLAQIFAPRGMLPGHLRQVGQDMTGADRVAADAVLCKLDCHGTVSATTPLFDAP